jgi:folate-binding protein YgfZ
MTETKIALLPKRGVVSVSGEDAERFLQGVITNEMGLLATQPALHAGTLTPQGKILFEFFVIRAPEGYYLETTRDNAPALADQLARYKLRSKVDIADVSADFAVAAAWGGTYDPHGRGKQPLVFADPRLPGMGYRELVTMRSDWALAGRDADSASREDYDAHRIALGVPEGGIDYPLGDTFPHEALFDQLNGVSFKKGCFVGQEVVARMQFRNMARKRVVPVVGDELLPASGAPISAGGVEIGKLGSVAGSRGLALMRIDRAAEATDKGEGLLAGSVPVRIELPSWATFSLSSKETGSPA